MVMRRLQNNVYGLLLSLQGVQELPEVQAFPVKDKK